MNEPGILFRTLPGYGTNGFVLEFPNGTTVAVTMRPNGAPEVTVEGKSAIYHIDGGFSRVLV